MPVRARRVGDMTQPIVTTTDAELRIDLAVRRIALPR